MVILATLAATGLGMLAPAYGLNLFFYIPAVVIAAYVWGHFAGFVAALLSVLAVDYFLVPPGHAFTLPPQALAVLCAFYLVTLAAALGAVRLRAVERTRAELYEAQRRAHASAELLNNITRSISGVDDLVRILSQALEHLRTLIPLTGGSILLVEGGELVTRAATGPFANRVMGHRIPLGQGRIWRVVETGEPLWGEDVGSAGLKAAGPPQSYLAVPLVWQGRTFGVLEIDSTEPAAFDTVDLELMGRVAVALSGSVELARRYAAEVRAVAEAHAARQAADRAADRTARLQAVTAALSEALTSSQVADVIVDQGIRALGAQAGSIALLTDDGATLEVVRAVGAADDLAGQEQRFPVSASTAVTEAMTTGEPIFLGSGQEWAARYRGSGHAPYPGQSGASATIPLMVGVHAIGGLTLTFREPRRFDEDDRGFVLAIGRQCALALERARLYERAHKVAEALQRAFLPAGMPQLPGVAIHAAYVPGATESAIGGDWYDVFRLPDGRVALSIGDVVGHGLKAAVIMGQVRQSIRAAALESPTPSMVLARAGSVLGLTYEVEGMATAVFGVLDPMSLTFTYATAGHPAPVLATPDGRVDMLTSGGLPLGAHNLQVSPGWTVSLPLGSTLVLYTDGLVEATRNVIQGEAALLSAARSEIHAGSLNPAEAILGRVLAGGRPPDDVAVLTVSPSPVPVEQFDLTVSAEPSVLPLVRQALKRLTNAFGLTEDRAFALQVAVGEAVNNVIEHAYGTAAGTLRVRTRRQEDSLVVEVEDHGRWRPERAEGRGYGIPLMRTLVDSVEVDSTPSGTLVRLAVSLPEAARSSAGLPMPATAQEASAGSVAPVARAAGGDAAVRQPLPAQGHFEIRQVDGMPVVEVTGELDLTNAREFEAALEQAAVADRQAVIVSMAGTSYFDSQALHVLLLFARRLALNRQRLLVVAPGGDSTHRIFEISGGTETFQIFDSMEKAVAACAKPERREPRRREPR